MKNFTSVVVEWDFEDGIELDEERFERPADEVDDG